MRYAMLAAVALMAMALASPASAARKSSPGLPTWDECYWLGWDRGVHVEQDELEGFMDQCMTGAVPFDNEVGINLTFPAHEGREVTVATRQPRPQQGPQVLQRNQQIQPRLEVTE